MKTLLSGYLAAVLCAAPAFAADPAPVNNVVLINAFEVPEDKLDAAVEMWTQARDFLQTQPGYVSTALHQALTPDARFQLVNIAIWESPQAFKAATMAMRQSAGIAPVEGLSYYPGLYKIIKTD